MRPLFGNGSLVATIDAGADMDGNYTFEWFAGSVGNTTNPITTGITNDLVTNPHTSTVVDLEAGEYWVRLTDTSNPNNACTSSTGFTLLRDPSLITVDASATDDTSCDVDNGQIQINSVTLDSLGNIIVRNIGSEIDNIYDLEYFDVNLVSQGNFTASAGISGTSCWNLFYNCNSSNFDLYFKLI